MGSQVALHTSHFTLRTSIRNSEPYLYCPWRVREVRARHRPQEIETGLGVDVVLVVGPIEQVEDVHEAADPRTSVDRNLLLQAEVDPVQRFAHEGFARDDGAVQP